MVFHKAGTSFVSASNASLVLVPIIDVLACCALGTWLGHIDPGPSGTSQVQCGMCEGCWHSSLLVSSLGVSAYSLTQL